MSYITKRSDDFWYIEVWDIQKSRDNKIADILGDVVETKPEYLAGSHTRLDKYEQIHYALFWKTKETAEWRLESMNKLNTKDKYNFIIKKLTREEFIKSIPEPKDKFVWGYHKKNLKLKHDEMEYLEKIKNESK